MRTKSLLAAAAIVAAGALSSMAQSNVYSLNIVGYVNVPVTNGVLALLANPLNPAGGDNNLTNVVKLLDGSSGGSVLYKWNQGTTSWDAWDWFDTFGWFNPNGDGFAPIGEGFFLSSAINQTITFVGEVQTGTSTNNITAGLNLLGNKAPVAGSEPGGLVGEAGDTVYTWDGSQWVNQDYFDTYGWFDLNSSETNGPTIKVAEGFFYLNNGANKQWIKTLNP